MSDSAVHRLAIAWALAGCATPPEPFVEAVLWVEEVEPDINSEICTGQLDHNFRGAVPLGQAGSARLTELAQSSRSGSGRYAFLTRQGSGELLFNLDGEVLTGTFVDERTVDVSWTSTQDEASSVEFAGLYRYDGTLTEQIEESVSLQATDDEATRFEGTRIVRHVQDGAFVESDEWSSSETSILFSSVPGTDWLEPADGFGIVSNRPVVDDCLEPDCRLEISSSCTTTFEWTAWLVEGGIGLFEALEDHGREGGIPVVAPPAAP